MEVTTTLVATKAVAAGTISWNSGIIWPTIIGFVTAAPAVLEAARPAAPLPPPMMRSAKIRGIPVTTMTPSPRRIPRSPVFKITVKSIVLPKAKAKNGIQVTENEADYEWQDSPNEEMRFKISSTG